MLKFPPDKVVAVARMMLALILFQALFVAFEVTALSDELAEERPQQQLASKAPCDDGACTVHQSDSSSRSQAGSEHVDKACDHCCTCQGHGPHTFVMAPDLWLAIRPLKAPSSFYIDVVHSLVPSSIYRPPIS